MEEDNVTMIDYDNEREPWTFLVLLVVSIPAIVCTLFILIYFFTHWNTMITKALHHHCVFLLIIISFLYTTFDLPFTINYYHLGYYPYRSISFCLWWYWFDYTIVEISILITATASIQRHILIFHSQWLQGTKLRWIFHYIPLIFSVTYPILFYIIFMFLYPCSVYYDPNEVWCVYPCYLDNAILYNIDWLLNAMVPIFILVIANIFLIIRVTRSMKRIRQQQRGLWKRQKRLTLQLLAVSSLYVLLWFPMTIVALLHLFLLPNLYEDIPNIYYIYHLTYFVCPLQAFLSIFALPELMDFIKQKRRRLMTIATAVAPLATVRPIV